MSVEGQREVFCEAPHDTSGRKSVLIIDDDIDLLRILRIYLQDDYKVSVINSGQMAVQMVHTLRPDVILLDYMMPGMNGADLLRSFREEEGAKDIPVFFLTGKTDEETIRECMSCKPSGYIVKPIAKAALLLKLRDFFGKKKA